MIHELQQIGFTKSEANVYVCALKKGACSVSDLAQSSGLNRVTVHSIVERFEQRRIMKRFYEGKKRRLEVVDPIELQSIVDNERENIDRKSRQLASLMPNLRELYRKNQRHMIVLTFKGPDAFRKLCDNVLNSRETVFELANFDRLELSNSESYVSDFIPRRTKLSIDSRTLIVDSEHTKSLVEGKILPALGDSTVRHIENTWLPFTDFAFVYGATVGLYSPEHKEAVVIRDKAMANLIGSLMSLAWERGSSVRQEALEQTQDPAYTIDYEDF